MTPATGVEAVVPPRRSAARAVAPVRARRRAAEQRRRSASRPLEPGLRGFVAALAGIVAVVSAARLLPAPVGPGVAAALDLTTLDAGLTAHVEQVLLVPFGGLVVVVARLVLGLRALGVLSPVLLGVALPAVGVVPAVALLAAAVGLSSLAVRPVLRAGAMPFAARVAVQLAMVAVLMLAPVVALRGLDGAREAAYLPPVAVALIAERFAATLEKETVRTTASRTALTLAEAAVIAGVGSGLHLVDLLARRPELLLLQVCLVVLVGTRLQLRLLEPAPPVRRTKRSGQRRAAPATPHSRKASS